MSSILLRINSHDRDLKTSKSTTSFQVNLSQKDETNYIRKLYFKQATMRHMFTNIADYNNYVQYSVNPQAGILNPIIKFKIPEGDYGVDDFISALQTAWTTSIQSTTAGSGDSIQITLIDGKFQILVVGSSSIGFFLDYETNPLICDVLNFDESLIKLYGTQFDSTGIYDLGGVKSVSIYTPDLISGTLAVDGENGGLSVNLLVVIPITVEYGKVINYLSPSYASDLIEFDKPINLNVLKIRLRNARGDLLSLQGQDVMTVFRLYYS